MLLRQMLYRTEIRLLPVIAGFWVRSPGPADYEELIRLLCDRMSEPALLRKMLGSPDKTDLAAGLKYLSEHKGIETADTYEKLFGSMRIAGIEKTLREKYWKAPVSTTEKLFYRGFIFRESRPVDNGLKDSYILPEDLNALLRSILKDVKAPDAHISAPLIIRPAAPSETEAVAPIYGDLPDLFTLAAGLKRSKQPLHFPGKNISAANSEFIEMLLSESGMFSSKSDVNTEMIRRHMVQNRTAARLDLIRIWRQSGRYNEIAEDKDHFTVTLMPDFSPEEPRKALLKIIESLPPDTWWSLSGFIAAVKNSYPLFLRNSFSDNHGTILDPDGNDLSGIGSWYQFEGPYIQFLLFGPLQWLGIVQTAYTDKSFNEPSAFRISSEGQFFLIESSQPETSQMILNKPNLETAAPIIASDGAVTCSNAVPRYFRYMAARCCEIEKIRGESCVFRITPNSLSEAEKEGISKDAFLALLKRFAKRALPPSLERMLSADKKSVLPATIYNAYILTVPQQETLEELLETARLEKWIIQKINQNSLMIDPKGIDEIRRFLMEKEIFVDIQK